MITSAATHGLGSEEIGTYASALAALNSFSSSAAAYRHFATEIEAQSAGFERPRIVYVFDSNICLSFLRPRERVFMDATDLSGLFSKRGHVSVERMTVRYLFEGRLPGQDSEPVFLTPTHWSELLNRTESFFNDKSRRAAKLKHQITDEKLARLKRVEHDPQRLLNLAEELDVARALQELGDALDLARRVEILFGKSDDVGRIRGLDQATSRDLLRIWNEARNQVSWRVENEWRRTLSEVKRETERARFDGMSPGEREAERDRLRQTNMNDAASLALIETLFMVDALAGSESPQRQYIFVTSDVALAEACKIQKERLQENGVPMFVWSPALFIPFADYEHFHEAMTSEPDTSESSRETSNKIYEALSSLREPHGRAQPDRQRVRTLRGNWNYAADLLTLIGNECFIDDFSGRSDADKVKKTYELLTYEKIGSTIEKMLQEKMGNVAERHGRASIEFALELLPERLKPPEEGTSDPRAPIHFLAVDVLRPLRDAGITGCDQWRSFLLGLRDDAAGEGVKTRQTSDVLLTIWSKAKGDLPSAANLLLTAAILTCGGMWDEALKCANWAITEARKLHRQHYSKVRGHQARRMLPQADPIALEASYLSALCHRMSLRNDHQFKAANKRLNDNIQVRSTDRSQPSVHRLANFRDIIEKSSLNLTAAVVQCIEASSVDTDLDEFHAGRFIPVEDLVDDYQAAIESLETVAEELDAYIGSNTSAADLRLVIGMMLRARTNIVGAEINRHFMPPLRPEMGSLRLIAEAARRVHKIKDDFRASLPRNRYSQEIYLRIAEFMVTTVPNNKDFEDLIRDFEIVLKANASIPDQVEMKNLENCLRGLAESRGLRLRSRMHDVEKDVPARVGPEQAE